MGVSDLLISSAQTKTGLPFSLNDYLELTDWTGRSVRTDKKGFIKSNNPKILQQLGLDKQTWVETVQGFSSQFHTYIGPEDKLNAVCQKQAKKWLRGLKLCRRLFNNTNLCPV